MARNVIQRSEMIGAKLNLGGAPLDLSDYATTGLLAVAVGPRGNGKTNAGLLMAEQLAAQGWVSVLIDPESELENLYGKSVPNADVLEDLLRTRKKNIVVVCAKDAEEFVPFGRAILRAADEHRKPIFVMIDEGQLFSGYGKRTESLGEAAEIINEFAGRGRKRALDLFISALQYRGTIHRSIFGNKNLTLVGCVEDPAAWSSFAPLFREAKVQFTDLNALAPGEFFCLSRRGVEKVRMPMAKALKAVAPKAQALKRALPATFSQWDRAMQAIPTERLEGLSESVVKFLGAVAGLPAQQMMSGAAALRDELDSRL